MAIYNSNGESLSACYNASGDSLQKAFNVNGVEVFGSDTPSAKPNYTRYSFGSEPYINHAGGQGFDILNGYLFMAAGNGETVVADVETGTEYYRGTIKVGHGNSVSFARYEYYEDGDEFPLLYISKDYGDPADEVDVYIYRVQREGTTFTFTLVKTLRWSTEQADYYGDAAYDYENRVMYLLAFSEADGNSETCHAIVSAWDMTNQTENQDGTFTPALISKVNCDFNISMRAGQQFHDGLIWTGSGSTRIIYAIDPTTGEMRYTITPHINAEYEGEAWLDNFNMVVGYMNDTYYLCTFQSK